MTDGMRFVYSTGEPVDVHLAQSIPYLNNMLQDCDDFEGDVPLPCRDEVVQWIGHAHDAMQHSTTDDELVYGGLKDMSDALQACCNQLVPALYKDHFSAIKELQFLGEPRATQIPAAHLLVDISMHAAFDTICEGQGSSSTAMDGVETC